jgi:2-oxoglutarate dehydrogenase E1 component
MCSGKIYYELVEERAKHKDDGIAIVRVEKLYPWWPELIKGSFANYKLKDLYWVQDEPANMGAATFVTPRLEQLLPQGVKYDVICRAESASPATGSHKAHVLETKQIMDAAFKR